MKRGGEGVPIELFFEGIAPDVSVVSASILSRNSASTAVILEELQKKKIYEIRALSLFCKEGGWVENILFG